MPYRIEADGSKVYYEASTGVVTNRLSLSAQTTDSVNVEVANKYRDLRDASNSATLVTKGNLHLNITDRVSIIVRNKDGNNHFTTGTYLVKSRVDLIEGSFTSTYELVKISSELNYRGTDATDYGEVTVEGEKVIEPTYSGNGGDLGKQIADTAVSYVGKVKYVYGEKDINTGIDCSGFTKYIYGLFGIQIPDGSANQRSVGIEVKGEPREGDLICYDGHVAICIGGGAIVHAANAKDGVKTSPRYNYKPVITIRRLV